MAEIDNLPSIHCLPYEVISIVLSQNTLSCRDVINFGKTCQLFYEFVRRDQGLWKRKLETNLQAEVFNVLLKNCKGTWLQEAENFYTLKRDIVFEIRKMSSKYYSNYNHEIVMQEITDYFEIAIRSNVSYYLTVVILCDIVKTGYEYLEDNGVNMVYSLTEIHYAKAVLHFLIHLFLVAKWGYMFKFNKATPERIVNFFLQWIDTTNLHPEEKFEQKMKEMTDMVKSLLVSSHSIKKIAYSPTWAESTTGLNMWSTEENREVLSAASLVVYQAGHMATTTTVNMDTINIVKTVETKCGNVATLAAIYSGVTRRCGVRVDLITFPDHLFLEWKENYNVDKSPSHVVNLATGKLQRKRVCPFSEYNKVSVKYDPFSLINYFIKGFHEISGNSRSWENENLLCLFKFMKNDVNVHNPYKNFIQYMDFKLYSTPGNEFPTDMQYLSDEMRQLIWELLNLNPHKMPIRKQIVPKRHESNVKFAIGMVCYHLKFRYLCVIFGWDIICTADAEWQARMGIHNLKYGSNQPFYSIISADYSERYIAQENLVVSNQPLRLNHLEEDLAKDFTHFDGFSYVPNKEKAAEYPDDENICKFHQSRHSGLNRGTAGLASGGEV